MYTHACAAACARQGVLDDSEFGPYVKDALSDYDTDGDKKLNAQEFLPVYKAFALKVAGGRIREEERRIAKEMKKKGILVPYRCTGDTSKFSGDAAWACSTKVKGEVMDAIKSAWNMKRTPLLVDASCADVDRDEVSSLSKATPLDELFGASLEGLGMGATMSDGLCRFAGQYTVLDMGPQMIRNTSIKQAQGQEGKSWKDVRYELRKKMVQAMSDGDVLVMQMATAAPPVKSSIVDEAFFPAGANFQTSFLSIVHCYMITIHIYIHVYIYIYIYHYI